MKRWKYHFQVTTSKRLLIFSVTTDNTLVYMYTFELIHQDGKCKALIGKVWATCLQNNKALSTPPSCRRMSDGIQKAGGVLFLYSVKITGVKDDAAYALLVFASFFASPSVLYQRHTALQISELLHTLHRPLTRVHFNLTEQIHFFF